MKLAIALAQIDIAVGRPKENLGRVGAIAQRAAQQAAHLLLLPELWLSGYDLERAEEHARAFEVEHQDRWAALCQETGLYIAGSVLAFNEKGVPANTAMIVSPQGDILARYAKVHRFEPMGETRYLASGKHMDTFDLPWGRTALAICYDLRFPEQFRHFVLTGASLVLLPAQWPSPRIEHWQILLRARAIENQLFIAACNRVGQDPNGTAFGGRSAVMGPWGEIVVEGKDEAALLLADLDLEEVPRVRKEFPVLADRRQDLY